MRTFFAIFMLILFVGQTMAGGRTVKCQIDSNNETVYKGKCLFFPEAGGSFTLSNPTKDKPLTSSVIMINLDIIKKGLAEVRGLTKDGINSRWGEAKRSLKDKACWLGEDFQVCAW